MTLRGARWRRILLASHLFPSLSPCLFPTCLLISLSPLRFFSLGAFGQRNLLVSRSSLLSPLLSVLRSGGFGDRTQVPSVFVLVSLLHSHMWLFSLGASGAQYAPCPLSVSVLVPLVLSNSCPYFSLSLSLVLLSRCLFGHMILSGSSLVLPCSLQHVSLIPSSLLLLLGKERISWPLVFLLNFSSFDQVTFPYPQSLPRVTLLTFLLVSNLSPYPLSTTVLLSRSPAFGTEGIVFLLFPFFPSLSLWSFPALSSLLSSFLLFSLLGPKIPLVSHVLPSVSFFSQFFPTCCFV